MKYIVFENIDVQEFPTYREAEIYCGENGIHSEEIYEEEE